MNVQNKKGKKYQAEMLPKNNQGNNQYSNEKIPPKTVYFIRKKNEQKKTRRPDSPFVLKLMPWPPWPFETARSCRETRFPPKTFQAMGSLVTGWSISNAARMFDNRKKIW